MRALSIALLSVVLGVLASRSVLSQQAPTPLQIGYVDVERVLDEYKKRGTVVSEIDKLREQNQKVGLIYREICNEVRVQAEQRGLASVFAYDPLPPGFETRMNALTVIQNRDVLWADSRLDITSAVVDALNAQLPPAPAGPK